MAKSLKIRRERSILALMLEENITPLQLAVLRIVQDKQKATLGQVWQELKENYNYSASAFSMDKLLRRMNEREQLSYVEYFFKQTRGRPITNCYSLGIKGAGILSKFNEVQDEK